jgi:hypothetical protein
MFPYLDIDSMNPAVRSQLDAQVALLSSLSQRSVDLYARVSELNLQLTRQALEAALDTSRQVLACTDPSQLSTTALRGLQPLGEHVRKYQEGLMGVLADTQSSPPTELGKAAAQSLVGAMFAGANVPDATSGEARRPH